MMKVGLLHLALGSVLAVATGCSGGRLAAPTGEPVADPGALVTELRAATTPRSPLQINFDWSLDEGGSRVAGRGVVRLEAPRRARLDLFGPRGETYLTAALVGEDYRLPPGASTSVALPSPALLWSAVGVLVEPADAQLSSATTTPGGAELRFDRPPGEVFAYTFSTDGGAEARLSRLERAGRQGVIETVMIERAAEGEITRTRYRNWAEYRDLVLEVQEIRTTAGFDPEIWNVDASR